MSRFLLLLLALSGCPSDDSVEESDTDVEDTDGMVLVDPAECAAALASGFEVGATGNAMVRALTFDGEGIWVVYIGDPGWGAGLYLERRSCDGQVLVEAKEVAGDPNIDLLYLAARDGQVTLSTTEGADFSEARFRRFDARTGETLGSVVHGSLNDHAFGSEVRVQDGEWRAHVVSWTTARCVVDIQTTDDLLQREETLGRLSRPNGYSYGTRVAWDGQDVHGIWTIGDSESRQLEVWGTTGDQAPVRLGSSSSMPLQEIAIAFDGSDRTVVAWGGSDGVYVAEAGVWEGVRIVDGSGLHGELAEVGGRLVLAVGAPFDVPDGAGLYVLDGGAVGDADYLDTDSSPMVIQPLGEDHVLVGGWDSGRSVVFAVELP